ncbi:DUF523 domain-containing protein [Acetivibrio saccincola]|jgi:uncharacterized protein YbbK (DUF523 family)|uniref:Uncharacterized protein n=1 Tax=Acetivibrio saccincola TaxID=1677857 RepID=A0A2K9E9E5_9FIRM|nr:DUF523 domain-containing protein [Acetivibrio saccincola]AUG58246.1 hypothetical protein HVS_11795 [Acetivibrio saccincola]HOA97509.1 DUF523 domain-containing protein [Acetivibrio saccincola]HQD28975.1 DUF523 domain-containing protein [Acetivibrio saccincola]
MSREKRKKRKEEAVDAILVSACLMGINCKHNGENNLNEKIIKLCGKYKLIPVCPEQLGGFPTPRPKAEIVCEDLAKGVLKVVRENGEDVTKYFENGAEEVLKIANLMNIKKAVLKEKSPSCGVYKIYDGSFSGKLIDGSGVTTKLLKENGIEVFNEYALEKFL